MERGSRSISSRQPARPERVPKRDRDNLVEQHRQRLLTRRLLGVIAILAVAITVVFARRWLG